MFNCSVCTLTSKAGEKRGLITTYRTIPHRREPDRTIREIAHERPVCQLCKTNLNMIGGLSEEQLRRNGLRKRREDEYAKTIEREERRSRHVKSDSVRVAKEDILVSGVHRSQTTQVDKAPIYPVNKPVILGVPVKVVE